MNVGTQLMAPEGLGSLRKGCVYHLLSNTNDPARVLLVHLQEHVNRRGRKTRTSRTAALIALPRQTFEHAIDNALLVKVEKQALLPPWLQDFDDNDIKLWMLKHPLEKKRADNLRNKLLAAVQDFDKIVMSRSPISEINRYAIKQGVNTARFRLAFCLYKLFGNRAEALASLRFRSGRYDRSALPPGTRKLGRTSKRHGKLFGHHLTEEDNERLLNFYRKNAAPGVKRTELYRTCMCEEFGCESKKGRWKTLFQPQGLAFPTKRQFGYLLKKRIGQQALDIDRYGAERARNLLSGSRGSFTENVGNLLEVLEADGYTVAACTTGFTGETLPKLTVVRIIDSVSRQRVGIGFSLGGERATAYHMALFCMAMDKVKFCSLFGLKISPEQWPGKGWPTRYIVDRGAGTSLDTDKIAFRELSVAYAGQSKSISESSHPRSDQLSGAPSYLQARAPINRLAVTEILRLIQENESVKVARTPRMVEAGVLPSPNGVWAYLERYGRKDGVEVSEHDATSILPRADVQCTKDGIQYYGETFRSPKLIQSGLLDRAAREGTIALPAHVLPMCARQLWIPHQGEMIQVQWATPFDDGADQTYLTLDELSALHKRNCSDRSALLEHQDAVAVEMRGLYEATFGHPMEKVDRRAGRAKMRGRAAKEETRAIQRIAEGRR